MITKRIIPCLDVKNGRVVKGVNFEGLGDVASPVELAKFYSDCGADELVFYDITASAEGRELFTDILCELAKSVFIPLTVGGGINTLSDFDRVLKCGADYNDIPDKPLRDNRRAHTRGDIGDTRRLGQADRVLRARGARIGGAAHKTARRVRPRDD